MPTEEPPPVEVTDAETDSPASDDVQPAEPDSAARIERPQGSAQSEPRADDAEPPAAPASEPEPEAEPEPEPEPEPDPQTTLRITGLSPDPVPASDRQQALTLQGEGFEAGTRVTVEWGNQRKTLAASRVTLVDEQHLRFQITVGDQPETWLVRVRNPDASEDSLRFTSVAQTDTPETDTPTTSAGEDKPATRAAVPATTGLDWLQSQPRDHFTLQLIASHQPDNLREFIRQHQLGDSSAIFESRRNGEPWYAVAYGSYPDRPAAQRAADELPAAIEPWIRRIGDIVPAASVREPTEAVKPVTDKPVPQTLALREHVAWLWDRDPARYTLQLIAGQSEAAVKDFIRRHDLAGEAVFYQTRRDRQPWYVVVTGDYPTREAALAARQSLPATLREQSPWPRPFSDIHADLYRN
jgi:septal ring-binding cell division protein DamX